MSDYRLNTRYFMKRFLSLIVVSGLVLSLCSCDKKDPESPSETVSEDEIIETTESESESESIPEETSETTEAETTPPETSEETTIEETTTALESETESETQNTEKARGNIFIDCSGKSADQIVANIEAIRTISSGIPFESYSDRFTVAPEMKYEDGEDITTTGYNWFAETIGSNDYIAQINLSADFENGKIYVDNYCGVSIIIQLSNLETAKEVFDKVNLILAEDYARDPETGVLDEVVLNDDRDDSYWTGEYGARNLSLELEPDDQGTYKLFIFIDVVPA